MKTRTLYASMIVFTVAGIVDSLYLSYTALTHTALSCSIDGLDGCNTVAQSAYSHFLGIPLGVYGLLFYALILVTIGILHAAPSIHVRQALIFFTTIGFLLSIGFMGLQAFVIHAICIYCAGSFVIALCLWIMSLQVPRRVVLARGVQTGQVEPNLV